jgi:hypothetical protein
MPPTELVLDVLRYVIAPALLAAAFVFGAVLWCFGPRASGPAAIAAYLAGYVAANYFRGAVPWLPERSGWHWLFWAATLAMLVEWAARQSDVSALAGELLRALTAGHAAWLLVPAGMREEMFWSVPAFAGAVFVEWVILRRVADQTPGGTLPLALAVPFLGAAAVLIQSHTALLADIAVWTAATLGGMAVVAWWRRAETGTVMPAVAVMLPGLIVAGYYETFLHEVPLSAYVLAALTPVATIVVLAPPIAGLRMPLRYAVSVAMLVVPTAITVALAMMSGSE